MVEEIYKFISKYIDLTDEEKEIIAEHSIYKFYPAGHHLLVEGQTAKHCHFVLKGLVRSYYLQEGEEKVMELFPELSPVKTISYQTGEPSAYFVTCIEDSIVSISDEKMDKEFFERLPRVQKAAIKMLEDFSMKQRLTFDDYKSLDPEKRYEKFLKEQPDLVNRVPQYMIASYLGIQPPSLSRIRKRIRDKEVIKSN